MLLLWNQTTYTIFRLQLKNAKRMAERRHMYVVSIKHLMADGLHFHSMRLARVKTLYESSHGVFTEENAFLCESGLLWGLISVAVKRG